MLILNKMTNPEAEQRRLCQLIHQNLSSYLDNNTSLLTKQTQKNLLISLSQVFTRIKQWIKEYEYNSDSGEDDPAIPIDYDDCSALSTLHSDDHHCLTRIISHLMSVLAFENPFVQHLTGNILVAIYELLVAYEGDWEVFINRVSLFMTYAIDKNLSAHMEPIIAEPKNSDIRLPVQIIPLKLKKSSCWSIPVALTRVLRNIMKILKQDFNSEIYDVYICLSMEMIACIPWHLLNDVSVVQTEESVGCLTRDVPLHSSNPQQKSKSVFKGNLLQFFCSLDENHDDVESGAVSERNQLLVSAVSNLIPDLLSWCLGEQGSSYNVDLFHYFRHKLLILMIRSMSQIHLDFDSLSSWLHLIWKYFTCSLVQQIYCPLSDLNDCLEDSPFGLSALHEKRDQVSPNHVQRLAIFLLFRCSFNLISLEGTTSCPCACAVPNTSFITDFNVASNCLSRRRGLIELHRWLQGQLHDNIFEDSVMYSTRCISFATSFLRLYIHEDDILFKMLLLLLEVPVYADRIGEEEAHSTAKTIFLVTDIFNPINFLFSLFLQIHYDHQVLFNWLLPNVHSA
ncbi:hypothetical protein Leryth_022515 [Lithospermum erythrorhizon]|nr:hypothetical protein Leryth_022515 [Lithospermum erythrorhizon]